MPLPAILLLTATLLPLAGFMLLLFLGNRLGTPLAGYVGTALMGGSFVFSILAMISWYGGGAFNTHDWGFEKAPINVPIRWIPIGTPAHPFGVAQEVPGWLDVGIFIDSLTITMFAMVTLVGTLVHVFSIGYMQEDGRYPRFFATLGLFCFSMLGLVLGETLLHILIFWEMLGFCSYLLIGFWYEKKAARNAAMKAFIANRVGDVGFLIGMGILFLQLGNVTLPHLWIALGKAGTGQSILQSDGTVFTSGWLTVMGIGLIVGAMAKSAQFPLHVWLADSTEAPAPVSALIQAATMVAAGVYMLGRVFPILTPDAKMFVAVIGLVTLTMGALIAVAQTDLKKVLAFGTLSQVGYMMLALGVGSWVGGLFHLMTHAFFGALLFLGVGSVIRAARGEQEMAELGGLVWKIPVTAITFLIGVFAISGVGYGRIGLSGFYSNYLILSQAGAFADMAIRQGHSRAYLLLFTIPLVISYLTPFYMMRCWMMTFWGKPRRRELYENARERPVRWGPLVVLAVLTALSGRAMSIQELLEGSVQENNTCCRQYDPTFAGFDSSWSDSMPEDVPTASQLSLMRGRDMVDRQLEPWGFTVGLLLAFAVYFRGLGLAKFLLKIPPWRWIRNWLYERMYFDELYLGVFVGTVVVAVEVAGWFDKVVMDGIVSGAAVSVRRLARCADEVEHRLSGGAVTGAALIAGQMDKASPAPQTGRIRGNARLMLGAIALAAAIAVIVVLSR